jgi:hypothetical protein
VPSQLPSGRHRLTSAGGTSLALLLVLCGCTDVCVHFFCTRRGRVMCLVFAYTDRWSNRLCFFLENIFVHSTCIQTYMWISCARLGRPQDVETCTSTCTRHACMYTLDKTRPRVHGRFILAKRTRHFLTNQCCCMACQTTSIRKGSAASQVRLHTTLQPHTRASRYCVS